jgi:hypothetical protein
MSRDRKKSRCGVPPGLRSQFCSLRLFIVVT